MNATTILSSARSAADLVVLEGLHPLKHALRFGADVTACVVEEGCDLAAAGADLAPDLTDLLRVVPQVVDPSTFASLCRRRPPVPVLSVARRPDHRPADALAAPGPLVLLEDPVHLGNLGAVVRVAAAADAGGVLTTGRADPWHPAALRGAAGLQFALPVLRVASDLRLDRPLVAFDPAGVPWRPDDLGRRVVMAFGTERGGLSDELLARADHVVAIPMRPGVSSLNLATSVAVALYAAR